MVRGMFFALLCGLMLFWVAPLGHADGGTPSTPAPGQESSGGQGGTPSNTDGKVTNPYLFIDVPANHWAVEDLKYLVEFGVITGLPSGAFNGDKFLTRYEATAMVARAMRMMTKQPNEVTKADVNAFQELLFQLNDKVEQNSTDIAALQAAGGPAPAGQGDLALRLTQTTERLSQTEVALQTMQKEMAQLKQDKSAPQASSTQLNKLQQQANANFIIAISSLFVGVIAIALATMT